MGGLLERSCIRHHLLTVLSDDVIAKNYAPAKEAGHWIFADGDFLLLKYTKNSNKELKEKF